MSQAAYGWKDLRMSVSGAASGAGAPGSIAFGPTGNIKETSFGVGDSVYLSGHVDHDILIGSTSYIHVHWSTSGTNVQPVHWEVAYMVAAGHDQENFPADSIITLAEAAHGTAWRHMITEDAVGLVAPEVDSLLLLELKRVTNGGTDNTDTVFGLFVDMHYEVGQLATPSRTPDFYTP